MAWPFSMLVPEKPRRAFRAREARASAERPAARGEVGQAAVQVGQDDVKVVGHEQELMKNDALFEAGHGGGEAVSQGLGDPLYRYKTKGPVDRPHAEESPLARNDASSWSHTGLSTVHAGPLQKDTFGQESLARRGSVASQPGSGVCGAGG